MFIIKGNTRDIKFIQKHLDKNGYAERVEKLLEKLDLAKVSGDDIEPILKCIAMEIDAYFEYKKSQKQPKI